MTEDKIIPEITSVAKVQGNSHALPHTYKGMIARILKNIFSVHSLQIKESDLEQSLIHVDTSAFSNGLLTISIFGKYQKHALKFFIEMLSNWLMPGQKFSFSGSFSSEFAMPSFGPSIYMVVEAVVHVGTKFNLESLRNNLEGIESEILLGMQSAFYAKRILEAKGTSPDTKTALIQEHIAHLMDWRPGLADQNLINEMHHFLVVSRDEFKEVRKSKHLSRIIAIQYYFKKMLFKKDVEDKRSLLLKIFRSEIDSTKSPRNVLGIVVGINFLRDKEIFEKRQLMHAIQNYIPDVVFVENSFLDNRRSHERYCSFYLEIEKKNGKKFTSEEISKLRKMLPKDLLDVVEELVHPIFMPRNEEEIMRNILALSGEVKFLRDLPQVSISFDEQTYSKIAFTIIVMRVVNPGDDAIKELFEKAETSLEYVHDRCKTVGYLRSKYIKEATVFRVKINKDEFIRIDNSIDLNKARQAVVFELLKVMGEFRDFNGGMITKQNELLMDVKALLINETRFNDLLLENFFFSMTPIVMRTILEPQAIRSLFTLLLDTIQLPLGGEESYKVNFESSEGFVYAMIKSDEGIKKEEFNSALAVLHAKTSELAFTYVKVHDIHYNGFIFRCSDIVRQQQFVSVLSNAASRYFLTPKAIVNS